jgi:lipoate-protein ligase A
MTEEWRLLSLNVYNAYMNMALDEAILRLRARDECPNTIRFYRWNPSAVSIGYFQIAEQEVNLEVCEELGVNVVRRMTGGGAVFHDCRGEITYSVIVDQDDPTIPRDLVESYRLLCGGIVLGLRKLGMNAEFKPINDVVLKGKKISGNAQTRREGVLLQHGTVLVDVDVKTMFKVLKVGKEKISDKAIKLAEERVTSIRRELAREIKFEEVYDALKDGFSEALGIELREESLTKEELELAENLRKTKYQLRDWTFKRPPNFSYK